MGDILEVENVDYELINGVYFKSEKDITSEYLIELCKVKYEYTVLVKIYIIDTDSIYNKWNKVLNGAVVTLPDFQLELMAEVELWPKYFMPKFTNTTMLYYDGKKYYEASYNSDPIASLMEAINFAIEYGLRESKITPY